MGRKRSNISGLSQALSKSNRPIYVVDHRRKIIYANAACGRWLGVEVGQLLDQQCDFHSQASDGSESRLANSLCPPPEAMRGKRMRGVVSSPHPHRGLVQREAEFLPLGQPADELFTVLVLVDGSEAENAAIRPLREASRGELHRRLCELREQLGETYHVHQIIGDDPAIVRVRDQVQLAVASNSRVLVTGPRGSGREHIARTVHFGWGRQVHIPLAPLACHLLDAELLKATVASFLGGCEELAAEQSAALLLLEVDQLPPDAQAVLADLLSIHKLNVRTIATSRSPLHELASQGSFRRDLAMSLSTIFIEVPPLRERPSDVPLLAQHFLERHNVAGDRQLAGFSDAAMDQLVLHPWPGNADELQQIVEQACQAARGPVVDVSELPERIRLTAQAMAHPIVDESIVLDEFLEQIERELLERALRKAKGNKAQAARLLGIPRARVIRRVEYFGLE